MATRKRAPDRCRSTPHPARHEARRLAAIRAHLSPKASRHVFEVMFEAVRSRCIRFAAGVSAWVRRRVRRSTHLQGSLLGSPHGAHRRAPLSAHCRARRVGSPPSSPRMSSVLSCEGEAAVVAHALHAPALCASHRHQPPAATHRYDVEGGKSCGAKGQTLQSPPDRAQRSQTRAEGQNDASSGAPQPSLKLAGRHRSWL